MEPSTDAFEAARASLSAAYAALERAANDENLRARQGGGLTSVRCLGRNAVLPFWEMAVRKLSIALDARVAKAAATAAERAGLSLSAWLNRAAEHELAISAGLRAVREWETEHGRLTADELAAADALLNRRTAMSKRRAG